MEPPLPRNRNKHNTKFIYCQNMIFVLMRLRRISRRDCVFKFILIGGISVFGLPVTSTFAELTSGMAADVVVGQPDFTSSTANNGGRSARTLSNPVSVSSDGRNLFITDWGNHRVLIYKSIPTTNNASADVVVGQANFTSGSSNQGGNQRASSLSLPYGVLTIDNKLLISDNNNGRVLIYNAIPTSNGASADVVIGKLTFTSSNPATTPAGNKLTFPQDISFDGKKLYVPDYSFNRLLIYNTIPTSNNVSADIVIGQPDFTTTTGGRAANKLNGPKKVFSDGKRLFIADEGNHRVLIYNIGESAIDLSPQFKQGKAVLGKVFWDLNGNGRQDRVLPSLPGTLPRNDGALEEQGIPGVRVVSDTGIYAITDQDGKYHFPFIETGQRLLKIDPSTLPEGAIITTESPRKVTITEGILTKVSFGIRHPEAASQMRPKDPDRDSSALPGLPPQNDGGKNASATPGSLSQDDSTPFLKVTITQDPTKLSPHLSITA